jgi:hypothetical protein
MMLDAEEFGSASKMNPTNIQIGIVIAIFVLLAAGVAISFSLRKRWARRPRVDYGGP